MERDPNKKNLQHASFRNENLRYADFTDADLRGADFTGADLTGADFSHVKTGIPAWHTAVIFIAALIVSAASGYVAMLAGRTIQHMLRSSDGLLRSAGVTAIVLFFVFVLISYRRGVGKAIKNLFIPVSIVAAIVGVVAYLSGLGTGMGMLYLILFFVLVSVMFIIGTIARAAAGTLSGLLFVVVALIGGIFGKSLGGGLASVVMAISCAVISKRALKGAPGFDALRNMAGGITSKWGTSFRDTRMEDVNFSQAYLHNADFSHADVAKTQWGGTKKVNCVEDKKVDEE
jgi:hypothetical protein